MSKTEHPSRSDGNPNLIRTRAASTQDTIRVPIEVVLSEKYNKVRYGIYNHRVITIELDRLWHLH